MTVIAMTIEPGAVGPAFADRLAHRLSLELLDLRALERDMAERRICVDPDAAIDVVDGAPGSRWRMTVGNLAARLAELTLEAALRGRVLIVGCTAATILHALSHVPTVSLHAAERHRASALQRQMRFPHLGSALLELESEDALVRHLVTSLYGDDWRRPDLADLAVDTERISERTCMAMIEQLAGDARCTASATAEDAILGRLRELR